MGSHKGCAVKGCYFLLETLWLLGANRSLEQFNGIFSWKWTKHFMNWYNWSCQMPSSFPEWWAKEAMVLTVVVHFLFLGHRPLTYGQQLHEAFVPFGHNCHTSWQYGISNNSLFSQKKKKARGLLCIVWILCRALNHFVMWNMSVWSLCVVCSYGFMQRLSKKNLL